MKYTFICMNNELNNVDKVTINQCKKVVKGKRKLV